MGLHLAAFITSIFFYYFENKCILNVKKSDLHNARSITNTFYFIDDLCSISGNGSFEKYITEIYPEELELKKEKVSRTKTLFLDIDLEIKDLK